MSLTSTQFADLNSFAGTTQTFALTVPSGTKRMLVGVVRPPNNSSSTDTVSSATWNGTSMTLAGASAANQYLHLALLTLVDPASGAHDLVITFSGPDTNRLALIAAYDDAYGTIGTPTLAPFLQSGTVTSATGDTVVCFAAGLNDQSGTGTITAGSGETEVVEYAPVNHYTRMGLLTKAGSTSVTMNPTIATSGDPGVIVVNLASSGGGAPAADTTMFYRGATQALVHV